MALRALTPGKAAYCSECGASTLPDAETCERCGATFDGFMDAVLCPICNTVNPVDAGECKKCQAKFPDMSTLAQIAKESSSEEEYLRNILRLSREKAKTHAPGPPAEAPAGPSAEIPPPSELESRGEPIETSLWKLAEPFDRMIERRKQRLTQMDALIEQARRRIAALSESTNAFEIREREELKRQIEEMLLEKEDILKLEEGLVDMENTYRNILRMQQEELRTREASLRTRIDAFRRELETREKTFGRIRERESDIVRREDEFRRLMNQVRERERELEKREELMRDKARLLDERHHSLSEAEVDLERRRWELDQKAQTATVGGKEGEQTITLGPSVGELNDLRRRVTEMEEQMERLQEEKSRLAQQQEGLLRLREEVRAVMKDVDDLLGELPDDKIRAFARSERFARYEKLLDSLEE